MCRMGKPREGTARACRPAHGGPASRECALLPPRCKPSAGQFSFRTATSITTASAAAAIFHASTRRVRPGTPIGRMTCTSITTPNRSDIALVMPRVLDARGDLREQLRGLGLEIGHLRQAVILDRRRGSACRPAAAAGPLSPVGRGRSIERFQPVPRGLATRCEGKSSGFGGLEDRAGAEQSVLLAATRALEVA